MKIRTKVGIFASTLAVVSTIVGAIYTNLEKVKSATLNPNHYVLGQIFANEPGGVYIQSGKIVSQSIANINIPPSSTSGGFIVKDLWATFAINNEFMEVGGFKGRFNSWTSATSDDGYFQGHFYGWGQSCSLAPCTGYYYGNPFVYLNTTNDWNSYELRKIYDNWKVIIDGTIYASSPYSDSRNAIRIDVGIESADDTATFDSGVCQYNFATRLTDYQEFIIQNNIYSYVTPNHYLGSNVKHTAYYNGVENANCYTR